MSIVAVVPLDYEIRWGDWIIAFENRMFVKFSSIMAIGKGPPRIYVRLRGSCFGSKWINTSPKDGSQNEITSRIWTVMTEIDKNHQNDTF